MSHVVSRRSLLGGVLAGAALATTACTSGGAPPEPSTSPSAADSDQQLRDSVSAAEQSLADRYRAPGLAADVVAIGARHVTYAEALRSGSAPGAAGSPPPRTTVAALVGAERAAARARADDCLQANDPDLVRLLALVGSGASAAAAALTGART